MRRLLMTFVVLALTLGPLTSGSSASGPIHFTDEFTGPGVLTHHLLDGGVLIITITGPQRLTTSKGPSGAVFSRQPKPLLDSNYVTVGIDRYDCCGIRLWTFTETVTWAWDYTQVTMVQPSSADNIWATGWWIDGKPDPNWYWIYNPTLAESYAQAYNKCCWGYPNQTDNPQIWIRTDYTGNWGGRTQCC